MTSVMKKAFSAADSSPGCSGEMGIGVYEQLRQIIAAMVTGGSLGVCYDLITGLRQAPALRSPAAEILYAAVASGIVFIVARASGAGTRLFFLFAAGGGFCLMIWAVHPLVRSATEQIQHHLHLYSLKNKKNRGQYWKNS